jgi:hypothetical protein
MSKTLAEAQVTTAKARSRLELGVHWRRLDAEAHLGYRKGRQSGIWLVRWRNHYEGGNYKQAQVGVANDINDKPANGILTFEQAVGTAREAVARARTEAASQAAGPPPTVRSAVESYVKERDARERRRTGRDVLSDAGTKLRRYVLGQEKRGNQEAAEAAALASVYLHALKEDDLITWREGLPEDLKVTTKQRFVNDPKAALNAAWPRLSADRKKLKRRPSCVICNTSRRESGRPKSPPTLRQIDTVEHEVLDDVLAGTAKIRPAIPRRPALTYWSNRVWLGAEGSRS